MKFDKNDFDFITRVGPKKMYRSEQKKNVFALVNDDQKGLSIFDKIQTAEIMAAARRYDKCKDDKYNTGQEESDYINSMFKIHAMN